MSSRTRQRQREKRAVVEATDSGDDLPAEKCWRADDFVAKASVDELTGSWLADGKQTTWTIYCQGGGGALDKQAEPEATEKALDSLLAHGT